MRGARYWVECDLCRDKGDHSVGEDCTTAKGRDKIYAAQGWRRLRRNGHVVDACPYCVRLAHYDDAKAAEGGEG